MAIQRVILIVLDSVGIGALPDAEKFGDAGVHTLKHVAEATGGFHFSALSQLGLGAIEPLPGVAASVLSPHAFYGKMAERSLAKDTVTGHWEMMGVVSEQAPKLYPNGFPKELMQQFEQKIGRKTLGNIAASGTVIIERLGWTHLQTGYPIIYTSGDSVFQIACHEEVVPFYDLYHYCEIARQLCNPYSISRVIARPFTGDPGAFRRTPLRKDWTLPPPGPTILEFLQQAGVPVFGIGKIGDIFSERGITQSYHTQSNSESIEQMMRCLEETPRGLIFVNLVDFDTLYGHRRDARGYAKALHEFDTALGEFLPELGPQDLLIITADHGCDPTYLKTTDHTREYVPLLVYFADTSYGAPLGTRRSFADVGATIAEIFNVQCSTGKSFYSNLISQKSKSWLSFLPWRRDHAK